MIGVSHGSRRIEGMLGMKFITYSCKKVFSLVIMWAAQASADAHQRTEANLFRCPYLSWLPFLYIVCTSGTCRELSIKITLGI
ncbi:uncharacterized protein LOC129923648 isoform X1 [Biomphalaria glabrata]|uniref:Uncharacterized protein LOC129923648 isoform X1 n=1 Tax=Biomphalaria glabrata TaxID=6526 RepID=A0A9W2Z9K4_BIOGL|nr:uncharacterized protein LOC129923648 isoform X1 [Biomphalaria glabrata]